MAVLQLRDSSVWVHSPVSLDDDLAAALAEIGEVKHIVSPNYEHTKFAQQVTDLIGSSISPCSYRSDSLSGLSWSELHLRSAVEGALPRCKVLCMSWAAQENARGAIRQRSGHLWC